MKEKLKIDKIKLQDLSQDEQSKVIGGEQVITSVVTVVIPTVLIGPIVAYTDNSCQSCQLSCKLGTDSCGQCTTNFKC